MKTPFIPISWGELFDKITILQIKLENLKDKNALKNVKIEYEKLNSIFNEFFFENTIANQLIIDLKLINEKLWNIEDLIRDKERNKVFNKEFMNWHERFILLTKRSHIKRKLMRFFGLNLLKKNLRR